MSRRMKADISYLSLPTLADEITAVRAVIADMLLVKVVNRTPRYNHTIEAMNAVLLRLIAIADRMDGEESKDG